MNSNDSTSDKIVFAHIMKTGGTTVAQWIQRHYERSEILSGASGWKELKSMPRHVFGPIKFVRGHFGSGILDVFGKHNGFAAIALFRDPVERVISHYWHLQHAADDMRFPFAKEPGFAIEDFLEHPQLQYIVSNYQTGNCSAVLGAEDDPAEAAQVSEETWSVNIDVAKSYVDRCEVVGITEDLSGFIAALSSRFGFYPDYKLRKQRSYRQPTSLSEPTVSRIRRLNEVDLELYHYAKARAAEPHKHYLLGAPANPNSVTPGGAINWRPGMPYWGTGWSDLVADERNGHIWSLQSTASMELAVQQNESYTLVFSLCRFVAAFQQEGFSLLCDGRAVTAVPLAASLDGGSQMFVAYLGYAERAKLTIGFKVSRLLSFKDIADDPDHRKRGVALSHLTLLSCGTRPPA